MSEEMIKISKLPIIFNIKDIEDVVSHYDNNVNMMINQWRIDQLNKMEKEIIQSFHFQSIKNEWSKEILNIPSYNDIWYDDAWRITAAEYLKRKQMTHRKIIIPVFLGDKLNVGRNTHYMLSKFLSGAGQEASNNFQLIKKRFQELYDSKLRNAIYSNCFDNRAITDFIITGFDIHEVGYNVQIYFEVCMKVDSQSEFKDEDFQDFYFKISGKLEAAENKLIDLKLNGLQLMKIVTGEIPPFTSNPVMTTITAQISKKIITLIMSEEEVNHALHIMNLSLPNPK